MNKKNNPKFKKNNIQDDKLKVLSPTLRQKKRFIKIKIKSETKFDFKELSEGINEWIILYLGIIEYGLEGIWILRDKFNFQEQTIIIKTSTKLKDKLIGVLSLITEINNKKLNLNILKVSGTLKGLEKNK